MHIQYQVAKARMEETRRLAERPERRAVRALRAAGRSSRGPRTEPDRSVSVTAPRPVGGTLRRLRRRPA